MNQLHEKDKTLREPEPAKQNHPTKKNDFAAGQVKVEFYTDPLCCWSWAFEKHWQKLLDAYAHVIDCRYIMCGMIPNWKTYNDPMNSVSKPIQMGPVWMHASEVTSTKMKYSIWHEDPPSTSYTACLAVKTVGLQSSAAEKEFLFNIRRALMEEGRNISKTEVLMTQAQHLTAAHFDFTQFVNDWNAGCAKDKFKTDLQQAKYHGIGRYPTLTFQKGNGAGIMLVGYRPYEALKQAFELFAG